MEARGDEASNFTGVRQLGQVIIFTGSGTRPTTSKLEPFFPVPRTARILCTSAAQDQACVQTRDAGSRLHGYVHPPSPSQPLLARRTWHGAGDAGFHPSVRAQRRGGSRAAQTVSCRLTQVAWSFLSLLGKFLSQIEVSIAGKGRRGRGGGSRPDWNENWNCEVEERRAFVQLRVARWPWAGRPWRGVWNN